MLFAAMSTFTLLYAYAGAYMHTCFVAHVIECLVAQSYVTCASAIALTAKSTAQLPDDCWCVVLL